MGKKITEEELDVLIKYIRSKCGIVLDSSKAYLLETRLNPLIQELNIESFMALYDMLKKDYTGKISTKLIDAICTNETYFFRDESYFKIFVQKFIPDFFEKNPTGNMKVWSAAASTGQEVYSLALSLLDAGFDVSRNKVKFLATDISDKAIAKASSALYSQFEVSRGIDQKKLTKYFTKTDSNWKIADRVRAMVQFRKVNLMEPREIRSLGNFDLIYCRNVAIYFDHSDRKKMFDTFYEVLNPGGILVIGATESLMGVSTNFKKSSFNGVSFYVKE
jgi:chemotaxis protein methyltransferase CheR